MTGLLAPALRRPVFYRDPAAPSCVTGLFHERESKARFYFFPEVGRTFSQCTFFILNPLVETATGRGTGPGSSVRGLMRRLWVAGPPLFYEYYDPFKFSPPPSLMIGRRILARLFEECSLCEPLP